MTHPMPAQRYVYRCHCERVIDGDTIIARLDLGLHSERVERIRLAFVNAPELNTPAGVQARAYVATWMQGAPAVEWPLLIETTKTDDYGRYLGTIWDAASGACLNDDLLASGNAQPYPAPKVTP